MPADILTSMHGITVFVSPSYEFSCVGEVYLGHNGYYNGFVFASECQSEIER